jgi:hypothetical protein
MRPDTGGVDLLLLVHAGATAYLAGLAWTVQLVVYPGFREVGPTPAWGAAHAAHTRRIVLAVGPAWAVQGGCVAVLLVLRPGPLVLAAAVLALVTVLSTVAVQVPLHGRLAAGWDDAVGRRLLTSDRVRTAAWTAGAVCALALLRT